MTRALRLRRIISLVLVSMVGSVITARAAGPDHPLTFERDVWPILAANCTHCHGATEKPKAGLDLQTVSRMHRGGENGPVIDPRSPDSSLLLEKIAHGEMPPGKVAEAVERRSRKSGDWLRAGARADHPDRVPPALSPIRDQDRRFWSFQTLKRPPVPKVASTTGRARTPIDHFLLKRLEQKGLSFSPVAEPQPWSGASVST